MKRYLSGHSLLRVAAVALLMACLASAASNTVIVLGVSDVWLAGQPSGVSLHNLIYPGSDTVANNAAVLASTGLNMTSGSYLTFSATGSTNLSNCASTTPDGGGGACTPYYTIVNPGPFFGLSVYGNSTNLVPINALIGIFINDSIPSSANTAPSPFIFSSSQASFSPQLNQVFFIGDGLTGTGTGTSQKFYIPSGATRLFLGSSDGIGANYDDTGSFSVTVTDSSSPSAVPVATPMVLVLTALILVGLGGYLAIRRPRTT